MAFLQVPADVAVAVDVPDGRCHRYAGDAANGWAPEKAERLRPLLRADE